MNETGNKPGSRLLRYAVRGVRLLVFVAVYTLVLWYGAITAANLDAPAVLVKIVIALIALGVTGSIYNIINRMAEEAKGGLMVLAEFLNTNLLEPRKRRLRAQGHTEGRAEAYAEMRLALQKAGINPDDVFPPDAPAAGGGKRDDDASS